MTERDTKLQEAWRALVGWHVGTVAMAKHPRSMGGVVVRLNDRQLWVYNRAKNFTFVWEPDTTGLLPDLDSPANWGHWAEALAERFGHASLEIVRGGFAYGDVGKGDADDTPAVALMLAACRHMLVCREQMPPAVLAWWKAEQEASDA